MLLMVVVILPFSELFPGTVKMPGKSRYKPATPVTRTSTSWLTHWQGIGRVDTTKILVHIRKNSLTTTHSTRNVHQIPVLWMGSYRWEVLPLFSQYMYFFEKDSVNIWD